MELSQQAKILLRIMQTILDDIEWNKPRVIKHIGENGTGSYI